jgi:glycosyltransferase involved in cell wall biosynthesis
VTRPLGEARIGYGGYSPDFRHPGDRRRFAAYADQRGLAFERADLGRPYDLVLITHNADIPGWTHRKRREGDGLKLVFELVDSYFVHTNPARRFVKGGARYALGTDSRLSPDFMRTLIRACECADAVICSTIEQRETIRRYNPNVFLSFDWFGGDLGAPKTDYSRSDKLRIVWEGQSTTVPNLQVIREPLNDLRDKIELHVVTDPLIYRHFGRLRPYPTMEALGGIECEKIFHLWEKDSFSRHVTAADLAVIPIYRPNKLWWGKPENKLVLLWHLGMPVLTGATPVYERTMAAAGLDLVCRTAAEWGAQLERMIAATPGELDAIGRKGQAYALSAYSKEEFQARFDAVFSAVGFDPTR